MAWGDKKKDKKKKKREETFFDFGAYMARQRGYVLDLDAARAAYEARLGELVSSDPEGAWRYFAVAARNRLVVSGALREGRIGSDAYMAEPDGAVPKLLAGYAEAVKRIYMEHDRDVYAVMPFGMPADVLPAGRGRIDMYDDRLVTGMFARSGPGVGDDIVRLVLDGRGMESDGPVMVLAGAPVTGFRPDGSADLAGTAAVWHLPAAEMTPVVHADFDVGRDGKLKFLGLRPFGGEWVREAGAGDTLEVTSWDTCREMSGLYFDMREIHILWDSLDVDLSLLRQDAMDHGKYVECPDLDNVPGADRTAPDGE